jgi:hypothetical protein
MIRIDKCPKSGNGVNQWVNIQVLKMLRQGCTDSFIYKKLISAALGCGRDIRQDISHSIDTGRQWLGIGKGHASDNILITVDHRIGDEIDSLRDLPPIDFELQSKVINEHKHITRNHWQNSKEPQTLEILFDLYGHNRICLGYSQRHSTITHLTSVNSLSNHRINLGLCQFIVPTPMIGEWAVNKAGKRAVRCLNNTCERWFLVVEFDHASQDDQARLHFELAKSQELRMLVYSGNKSIHGWYDVYRKPEKETKQFMKQATQLGADPMTWIRCQYVRFPGGVNSKTKQKQEILYYNYGK